MSEVRAHLVPNIMLRGVELILYSEANGGTTIWAPGGDMRFVQTNDQAVESPVEPLRLRDEEARALLTALLRHYEGGEDNRSLRRDYDAERKRVDQFIAHLTRSTS